MAQKAEFLKEQLPCSHPTTHHPLWARTMKRLCARLQTDEYHLHKLVCIVQVISHSIYECFGVFEVGFRAQHNLPSKIHVGILSWNSSSLSGQAFRNKWESMREDVVGLKGCRRRPRPQQCLQIPQSNHPPLTRWPRFYFEKRKKTHQKCCRGDSFTHILKPLSNNISGRHLGVELLGQGVHRFTMWKPMSNCPSQKMHQFYTLPLTSDRSPYTLTCGGW